MKVERLSGFSFIFFPSFGSVQEEECQWKAETPGAAFKQQLSGKEQLGKRYCFIHLNLSYSTSTFSEKRSDGETVPKLQSKSLDCIQALKAEGQVKTALRGASRWRAFNEVSLKVSEGTQVFLFVYILFSWTEIDFWKLCCGVNKICRV